MNYAIVAAVMGAIFIFVGIFFPVNLDCPLFVGGGSTACSIIVEQAFTLTLLSALLLAWGAVMLILGILALYNKI
ncbi:MAG TPA: hypothetical protein VN739_02835 [Nitrososphaerales archaeon]|nr:hypothetical protein [Nitrososphaerales archaeon]